MNGNVSNGKCEKKGKQEAWGKIAALILVKLLINGL